MSSSNQRAAENGANIDPAVAEGFGREWSAFRQGETDLTPVQRQAIFEDYFAAFPWDRLPPDGGVGLDLGCGSGRWAALMAPRVKHLHLVDASAAALAVAKENLAAQANVTFHLASVSEIPLPDGSLDFAYSLGVLHHVPDTQAAIADIARKLKPGAPLLLYLYYAFDNRPGWYRSLWKATDVSRRLMARLPPTAQWYLSQGIAAGVYWPLARSAALLAAFGTRTDHLPLAWYRDKSFYVMRTDAYDRFCTRLEKRYTRSEIVAMLTKAGFGAIKFSDRAPFWCAAALKLKAGFDPQRDSDRVCGAV